MYSLTERLTASNTFKSDIESVVQAYAETQSASFRFPKTLLAELEEVAQSLDINRSELMKTFLQAGLDELNKQLTSQDQSKNLEGTTDINDVSFWLLNTNIKHYRSDHFRMVKNGEASAMYGHWKKLIKKIKKGDVVFLYHSGVGIRGYGIASGDIIISDHNGNPGEMYTQLLSDYRPLSSPLTAKRMKDIANRNLKFIGTLNNLSESGELIYKSLDNC